MDRGCGRAMAEVGVQDPARAWAFFTPSFQPPLEREEDG